MTKTSSTTTKKETNDLITHEGFELAYEMKALPKHPCDDIIIQICQI